MIFIRVFFGLFLVFSICPSVHAETLKCIQFRPYLVLPSKKLEVLGTSIAKLKKSLKALKLKNKKTKKILNLIKSTQKKITKYNVYSSACIANRSLKPTPTKTSVFVPTSTPISTNTPVFTSAPQLSPTSLPLITATSTSLPTSTPTRTVVAPTILVEDVKSVSEFGVLNLNPKIQDPQGLPVTLKIVSQPQSGYLTVKGTSIIYKHTKRDASSDSFKIIANNGFKDSAEITVTFSVVQPARDNPQYIVPTVDQIRSLQAAPHPRLKDYSKGERTLELYKAGDKYAINLVKALRARAENTNPQSSHLLKPLPVYADALKPNSGHWVLSRDTMCELYHSTLYTDPSFTGGKISYAELDSEMNPVFLNGKQVLRDYTPQEFRSLLPRFGKRLLARYADNTFFSTWGSDELGKGFVLRTASQLYDCFYNEMTPAERQVIREAIKTNVLNGYLSTYQNGQGHWWYSGPTNWTSDVNWGVLWAALAILNEDPDAATFITGAIKGVRTVLKAIGPDGGWHEGAISYGSMTGDGLMAISMALEKTYGHDFGIGDFPGLSDLEMSKHFLSSPSRLFWDYSDNDLNTGWTRNNIVNGEFPGLTRGIGFWAARRVGNPDYSLYETKNVSTYPDFNIFVLYDDLWKQANANSWPLDKAYRGPELVTMRSGRTIDSLFIGMKGGRLHEGQSSHYALDIYNFVVDWAALRWVWDMGIENYGLKHADSTWTSSGLWAARFGLYRESTKGANVIIVDGKDQVWRYKSGDGADINSWPGAKIETFVSDEKTSSAVINGRIAFDPNWATGTFVDVDNDMPPKPRKVLKSKRGAALVDNKSVALIVDEMTLSSPGTLTWQFHTVADVAVGNNQITLTQYDKKINGTDISPIKRTMQVKVIEPQQVTISVNSLTPEMMYGTSSLKSNCVFDYNGAITNGCVQPKPIPTGMKRVEFKLANPTTNGRFAVAFIPEGAEAPTETILPLDEWKSGAVLSDVNIKTGIAINNPS